MRPWVIRQGDFLLKLANQFGFNADTVWQDSTNASLRALRPNPNILLAGDVLYIPDPPASGPSMKSLAPGSTNNFVAPDPPTVTISHQFVGDDSSTYASKAYTIQELDQLTGLTTDANGVLTFQAPVTLQTATVTFTDTGEAWALSIGSLDPIDTLSGIFQRLQNLGYLGGDVQFDPSDLDTLRAGLRLLKGSQAGSSESAPASSPSPDSAPSSSPAPPSTPVSAAPAAPDSAPASAPGVGGSPSSTAGDSAPASNPSPDSAPPSDPAPNSAPPSDPAPDSAPPSSQDGAVDNAGLGDDGTLDTDTSGLLLKAYGF
jgi:hypothetical protein